MDGLDRIVTEECHPQEALLKTQAPFKSYNIVKI